MPHKPIILNQRELENYKAISNLDRAPFFTRLSLYSWIQYKNFTRINRPTSFAHIWRLWFLAVLISGWLLPSFSQAAHSWPHPSQPCALSREYWNPWSSEPANQSQTHRSSHSQIISSSGNWSLKIGSAQWTSLFGVNCGLAPAHSACQPYSQWGCYSYKKSILQILQSHLKWQAGLFSWSWVHQLEAWGLSELQSIH